MKKTLRSIICCLLCVMMVSLSAVAAVTPTMNMSWQGDYANNKLVIKFTSPASYTQQVTAVMYKTSVVGTPVNTDYLRVMEITAQGGVEQTIMFTLTNDLTDGQYYVRLQGNGVMGAFCKEIQTVTIQTPAQADNLVSNINNATANPGDPNYIGIFVEPNATALGITIPVDATLKGKVMTALVNTRDTEYTNSQTGVKFTNLNQVRDAYNKSEIIVNLHEGASASSMQALVEANAALLELDITEEDYVAEASYIYNMIVTNKSTYEGIGINSCATLVDAIKKYRAIKKINDATLSPVNTLLGVMNKYHEDLGVSVDSWSKYVAFESDSQRETVLRQIYNKNFTVPSLVKKAFEDGVTAVYNLGQGGGDLGGGDLGGGSGGDSFSMGNDSGSLSEKPNPVPTVKGFYDCTENHWAYSYVENLYDLGFISGYADGSFQPENNVTREEFVKMVIGAAGLYRENAQCDFADVPSNSWSYKYVASAYTNGIVVGSSASEFGAKNYITREDVCVISARILEKYGKELAGKSNFKDAESISDYAKDSVDALVKLGIINGFEDGTFGAKQLLTRAQAAKIISLLREAL